MTFDIKKFNSTKFKDRVEAVPVPRLASFFNFKKDEKDKSPVWKVRGLDGFESAEAKEEVKKNSSLDTIVKAIGTSIEKDKIEGIKELAGIHPDKTPDDLVLRFSWLKSGSVDPVCDQALAMKLASNFPEDFYLLTNKIMILTGKGKLGE